MPCFPNDVLRFLRVLKSLNLSTNSEMSDRRDGMITQIIQTTFRISTYPVDFVRYSLKVRIDQSILFHVQNDVEYPLIQFRRLERLNVGIVFS